ALAHAVPGRIGMACAHANVALVKYWGKRDERLHIPWASSISMTLGNYWTTTRFTTLANPSCRVFLLDGQPAPAAAARRVAHVISVLRERYGLPTNSENSGYFLESWNHVPVSSGFASSASGFAALAGAFADASGLKNIGHRELSRLARLGSGSASRSIDGGFVEWHAGTTDTSSYAEPLNKHPTVNLRMMSVMISNTRKEISSTEGMRRCARSPYFSVWIRQCEDACRQMRQAIAKNDIRTIGSIAEDNARQMHAMTLCAGFTYFTPGTLAITQLIEQLRADGLECFWTCDAGANPKILVDASNENQVAAAIAERFPQARCKSSGFGPGIAIGHD
ncbi:MAG: diphosphomevalonate decarboxylase, partial [Bifidobacteriaceae bacterium]|nr:diphosphomevalonate decarboxylase [Bifidobacteriaceae bacterium]